MDELISTPMKAKQLMNMLRGLEDFDLKDCGLTDEICESLDAKTIIHAHWESTYGCHFQCSHCQGELPSVIIGGGTLDEPIPIIENIDETDYCPHCGAKMDEKS